MPIASMAMYDMLKIYEPLDSLWVRMVRHLKREGLSEAPDHIQHGCNLADLWNDPDLWFSQCCSYDIVRRYGGKLRLVATPHYGAPEREDCDYASMTGWRSKQSGGVRERAAIVFGVIRGIWK